MSNKHLPRLFAQALNEKRVELFDEFIHSNYNNHNTYVEPGPAGVKVFFRHYLDAFPDTNVVMDDVIEEGNRISARFTYNGIRSWSALMSKDQQQKALRSTANVRETAQLIASVFAEYQFLSLKERKHLARQFVKRIEVENKHFTALTLSLPAPDAKIRTTGTGHSWHIRAVKPTAQIRSFRVRLDRHFPLVHVARPGAIRKLAAGSVNPWRLGVLYPGRTSHHPRLLAHVDCFWVAHDPIGDGGCTL